ncbi:hypothetical protein RRG08_044756 [Elysia crispata]|uniref:Uncharacterized protein n=1 Tax=Elysia crispata TaxID=231223 RepID=A0AAE1DGD5_9GAST|nr:hypothetical protein RRG08_044756 [Elysia crispata]
MPAPLTASVSTSSSCSQREVLSPGRVHLRCEQKLRADKDRIGAKRCCYQCTQEVGVKASSLPLEAEVWPRAINSNQLSYDQRLDLTCPELYRVLSSSCMRILLASLLYENPFSFALDAVSCCPPSSVRDDMMLKPP